MAANKASIHSAALRGVEACLVEIEVYVGRGLPGTSIVGLPDPAIRESRERVKAAILQTGLPYPTRKVLLNLAPAHLPKKGPGYDLPIALGVLEAAGVIPTRMLQGVVVVGELSLTGTLRPVAGLLPILRATAACGARAVLYPRENGGGIEGLVTGIELYPVASLAEAVDLARGRPPRRVERIAPSRRTTPATRHRKGLAPLPPGGGEPHVGEGLHLLDEIRGQVEAKAALAVAAAGGHNLLLVGPPGSGKSLLARSLPALLPRADPRAALEIASIASVIRPGARMGFPARPFRSPHPTVSPCALLGGGPNLRPGEITLAHRGVLFLDELPEFSRPCLEGLRQPLEEGAITIGRAQAAVRLPARFLLVAAMNPCPCGYLGHPTRECTCTPPRIRRYRARVSGPLLDRFDIQIEVPALPGEILERLPSGPRAAKLRASVAAARHLQDARYAALPFLQNADLDAAGLREHAPLEPRARAFLRRIVAVHRPTGRGQARLLKVARTLADLDGGIPITTRHLAQALHFRLPDPSGVALSQGNPP